MQDAIKKEANIESAQNLKVAIVYAQFNSDITEAVLADAKQSLVKYGVEENNISTFAVTGSVEIPVILQAAAKSKKYDALVAIGAIIKGETDHYDYVAKFVCEGVLRVMMGHTIPVGFAVLTTPNKELAQKRIHIGTEAVEAVLQNVSNIKQIV